ncbi:hypothetical protein EAG_08056 [Camponotus floridanus]|uniref:Uncharacterized protein n=1 Tax=Camponotus floridanus TaxID=104421 RepID=E1ZZ25_CAMFO|nr:hypothetical protein EAG_08056 [Camponotus floridanus]
MVWVRFASVQEKLEVMKGKTKLRDRRERITDDLTERERRVDWLIKREVEMRRREGKSGIHETVGRREDVDMG